MLRLTLFTETPPVPRGIPTCVETGKQALDMNTMTCQHRGHRQHPSQPVLLQQTLLATCLHRDHRQTPSRSPLKQTLLTTRAIYPDFGKSSTRSMVMSVGNWRIPQAYTGAKMTILSMSYTTGELLPCDHCPFVSLLTSYITLFSTHFIYKATPYMEHRTSFISSSGPLQER